MAQAKHALKLALLAAAMLLAGCSASAPRTAAPGLPVPTAPATGTPSGAPPPVPRPPPPPPRDNRLSPATRSLVAQAHTLAAHGDLDGASSTLDRALRIDPSNPLLWVELGRLRLSESDAHQAEGCGRKALALASGDHRAQRQAGRLLADALRAQQRNQEAQELERQPFMQ